MPLNAQRQRARRLTSNGINTVIEQPYVVEAGTSEGIKYRHAIQLGYDAAHFCNYAEAYKQARDAEAGRLFPTWRGSVRRGRFSKRNMFCPTWVRVYREGELIHTWSKSHEFV